MSGHGATWPTYDRNAVDPTPRCGKVTQAHGTVTRTKEQMQQDTRREGRSRWWIYGALVGAALAMGAYWLQARPPAGQVAAPEDPHAQVARRAAERMAGVRCIGDKASPAQKDAIARMLAVNTLAPRGAPPAWLPESFTAPANGPDGAEAWQSLASACPNAPAFGTPFGFPSAEIESALRADPVFAAASDRQWAAIDRYRPAAR